MAGYAVMAHMLAAMSGLEPGILTMTGGNCHIYADHVKQVKRQLRRKSRGIVALAPVPKKAKISDYTIDDFKLVNYKPAGVIKAKASI